MNFIKRAFWSMKAKKGKTFLQAVVFSVICIFVLSGLTIQSAAKKSSELARQQLGGSVTLQVDRHKQMAQQQNNGEKRTFESTPISVSDANKLTALQHVKNYNFLTSASANAESFDAIESSGESAASVGHVFQRSFLYFICFNVDFFIRVLALKVFRMV
ncbi:hypothetical protein AXI59_06025 [Bacillus nakamurai]|nr:hypothetical protein AXI59_06025 [Bacillus nakamurai]